MLIVNRKGPRKMMTHVDHEHDRERFPTDIGSGRFAMREHLLLEHPHLAAELLAIADGGVGYWPSVSYVDEAHLLEHRFSRL